MANKNKRHSIPSKSSILPPNYETLINTRVNRTDNDLFFISDNDSFREFTVINVPTKKPTQSLVNYLIDDLGSNERLSNKKDYDNLSI